MTGALQSALARAGIYYAKRQYMPCGIDWLWDIHRLTRGGPVRMVFDVGANVGQTTGLIKQRFPAAAVHAFEPAGATYRTLEQNVRELDDVTCHRLALCERVGQATMTISRNSLLNRLVPDVEAGAPSLTESVDTDTVDHFCVTRNIERIDILKVDAEGADLRVLQGADAMLRERRIAFAFVEFGFDSNDAGHVYFPAIYDYLEKAGMCVYSFYDYYHEDNGRRLVFANGLFLNPSVPAALEPRTTA